MPNKSPEEMLAYLSNLCESDPDAGLELIKGFIENNLEFESNPIIKFCKALAYGRKGFKPLIEKPWLNIDLAEPNELRSYLNDENLNDLEYALSEIRQIEDIDPRFIQQIGTDEEKIGECKLDAIATVVERCKPGRVQQILGKTKLFYFGLTRIKQMPHLNEILHPEALKPFLEIFFTHKSFVSSALILAFDTDASGRKYIMCTLFQKPIDELGPKDTFERAIIAGTLYLFDDGSFSVSVEKK